MVLHRVFTPLAHGLALGMLLATSSTLAATFVVDTSTDSNDITPGDGICADADGACSLRAAIEEANASTGADVITLPEGVYTLSIAGIDEDAAVTGDLDITDDLTIQGAGATTTLVDGSDVAFDDRLFHVLNSVPVVFDSLTLQGSHAGGNIPGGAIATGGDLRVSNAVITGNTAGRGGAIHAWAAGSTTDISNTMLTGNTGTSGGAVYVAGTLNLSGSTLSGNFSRSYGYGGAVYGGKGSTLNITAGSLVDGNTVGFGGQAAVFGADGSTVNIIDSTVSNTKDGRGVEGWIDATVNIIRSRVSGNLAGGVGMRGAGAVLNVTDSTIDANSTPYWGGTSGIDGAGISAEGTFHILRSTIANNVISGYANGAGISGVSGTVVNSTISGNRMDGPGNNSGGGLSISGKVFISNSTIANNNISRGGGWISHGGGIAGGTVVLENTIISGNSPNNCALTSVASGGYNVENQDSCGLATPTDQVNTDPLLAPLMDNGGWTQTHALLSGSPAVDAGDATVCAGASVSGMDQRGFPRPWGAGCDIGAYEDMPTYRLSLTVAGTGSGRVVSSPGTINCVTGTCTAQIGENTSVALMAVPEPGSTFAGWAGDCQAVTGRVGVAQAGLVGTSGSGTVLVDADKSCTATFTPIQHTLTVVISPLGKGLVRSADGGVAIDCGTDCSETLPGTTGVITLGPANTVTGWGFVGWDGCDSQGANTSWCTMTLDADKVLTANYASAKIEVTDAAAPVDDHLVDFGEVPVGETVELTVTITSSGQYDLNDIWVGNEDTLAEPFGMRENCSDSWMAPGETCSFTVIFTPPEAGSFADSFDIAAQDPVNPVVSIAVSGVGVVETAPPADEPVPTAQITFGLKGKGGGGAAGPLELLMLLGALCFVVARRRAGAMALTLGASLLVASAVPFQAVRAEGTGWYLGAAGGWSSSDYSDSDLRSHLVNRGYAITSTSVDDSDTGWKLFGGYRFNRNWAVEAAWVDLGDLESSVGGTIDDAQVPALLSDAAAKHGYLAEGASLAGVAIWPLSPQFEPFVKLGAFSWKADVDIDERSTGLSISKNRSGTDLMGGIGLRYLPAPAWEFRAEYEYYDIDPDAAGFISIGIGYHF